MKPIIFVLSFISTLTLSAQNDHIKLIPENNVISSYCLDVTYDKTVHLIFPSGIAYIDLGSSNIIAGKAEGAENVVRVKAAVKDFTEETNFSVITEEGSFYSFIVNYSHNPEKLNIEMKDFLHAEKLGNKSENSMEVHLSELGDESPQTVQMAMERIYKGNRKKNHLAESNQFGIEFSLRGIFCYNGLLFFQTEIKNTSDIPFDVDFLAFKIVDKKVVKRTAIQETIIEPVRAYNYLTSVKGKESESTVFAFQKFTIPDKKQLVVELFEKNGGRHQRFVVKNGDLVKARTIGRL
ncbi:MAG: conjugative transposon protein TraN [Bacteroidetes bacterium GWF2_42_66]|nr:MAG: conjugative transposon protein TraN [Bacteroidetes bacterium GWA2_42_15]OFX98683.1 MAG: conjugative transposon protein TraN [Bacteroidetes bacterium GWE2_42_39]OFY43119.1 MAG: conjugative transposon protein TraN [Bacteroidetes bacterium GWF2_42_66]HBL77034.1 conjugative transposon protein TraN [Prolixibacteraceae bacterium]HCR90127.1 conjugative transposon protein TraN [Prolixibacteraceae bacterium]